MFDEFAWAVGLIEGEGYLGAARVGDRYYPRMSIHSTDKDVLERVQATLGVGKIYGPYKINNTGRKPVYTYYLGRKEETIAMMKRLHPYLNPRRQAQIDEALGKVSGPVADDSRSTTERGHDMLRRSFLADPAFVEATRKGIEAFDKGDFITLDELRKEVDEQRT